MTVQMLLTLNLNRISCKAFLSGGRLSINDTDDTDDRAIMDKEFSARLLIGILFQKNVFKLMCFISLMYQNYIIILSFTRIRYCPLCLTYHMLTIT